MEKKKKLVAKSSVVPQRPSRLRDWWWWWTWRSKIKINLHTMGWWRDAINVEDTVCHDLLGQGPGLQLLVSLLDPGHCKPPCRGAGLSQFRDRLLVPAAHVTLHEPHDPQLPQAPSTGTQRAGKLGQWPTHAALTETYYKPSLRGQED